LSPSVQIAFDAMESHTPIHNTLFSMIAILLNWFRGRCCYNLTFVRYSLQSAAHFISSMQLLVIYMLGKRSSGFVQALIDGAEFMFYIVCCYHHGMLGLSVLVKCFCFLSLTGLLCFWELGYIMDITSTKPAFLTLRRFKESNRYLRLCF